MASIPYVRPAYRNDASAARMSDLIRSRGAIAANAANQQGAANAYLWGNLIDTTGRTMSDLVKYQAGEPERKLREAQTVRLTREENDAARVDVLTKTTAGLPLMARAKVFADAGFEKESAAYAKMGQDQINQSNKQQVGALIGVYGEDNPEEVRSQGMAVDPEMTSKYLKDRQEEKDKAQARALDALKSLPYALKAGAQVWATPVTDQADLDQRIAASTRLAEMVGGKSLMPTFTPTFGPQTEQERAAALKVLDEAKAPTSEFAVFYHGWEQEHGEPKTVKDSAALISAYSAAQRKPDAAGAGTPFKDNPKFPVGVDRYLTDMRNRGYSRDQAEAELARATPDLQRDHPNMSGLELQKAIDVYWPQASPGYDPLSGKRLPGTMELKAPVNSGLAPPLSALTKPAAVALPPAVASHGPVTAPASVPPPAVAPTPAVPPGPAVGPTNDAALQARVEALMAEIQGLERQGQVKSPLYAQRLAELRRLLAG